MPTEVVVLGYHKIGPAPEKGWPSWYYVPEAAFAGQLRLLRESGFGLLSLDSFLDGIDRPETFPPKAALVTFDDGYKSLLRHALPPMREAGCPGVVFVPTAFAGGLNGFDHGVEPEEEIASWDDLAALEAGGIAVQPHGVSHRSLGALAPEDLDFEIAGSKREIEARLGRPAAMFSFPYGDNGGTPEKTAAVEELLRRHGFRAACVYGGKHAPIPPALLAANRFRITRIAMGSDTDLARELPSP